MEPSELEKIRNYITQPVLQLAKHWLDRQPRSLEEKKAYSDAIWDLMTIIFPGSAQVVHTCERLEKLFFN